MRVYGTIRVKPEEENQRLDRLLRRHYPSLTQGVIEKVCRKGELLIDGEKTKPSVRVMSGQTLYLPALLNLPTRSDEYMKTFDHTQSDLKLIQSAVIYIDNDIIVINKPSGLASQGGSGQGNRHVDALTTELTYGFKARPRLVHRLDRDTSGLLVLARTERVAGRLSEAFRQRKVKKVYWALVSGVPQSRSGIIRFGLLKSSKRGEERMLCINPDEIDKVEGAKRAVTQFKVIAARGSSMAWLALNPVTGRTHQLRAHLEQIGHPIVGDEKYGGKGHDSMGKGWGAGSGLDLEWRLHLHARSLAFEHPVSGQLVDFVAPLPHHMQRTWHYFGWSELEGRDDTKLCLDE